MSSTADIIFYGGSIITMNEKNPFAEALAVTGNLITAVGKLDEVFALAGETTKLIYLNQKALFDSDRPLSLTRMLCYRSGLTRRSLTLVAMITTHMTR